MLFSDFSRFDKSWFHFGDYEIQRYFGKFGIVHFEQPSELTDGTPTERAPSLNWVISPCYDNIFHYMGVFALCKGGKVGAVRCVDGALKWIAPCEYHAVDCNGWETVIFSKLGEERCYFSRTDTIRNFSETSLYGPDGRYIFAIDANSYYIIDSNTDVILWTCAKDDRRLPLQSV